MHKIHHKIILPLLLGCIALLSGACSSTESPAAAIADAEQALADGDWERSQQICNSMTADGMENLSEEELGKLAILYMKLSETPGAGEHVAEATQCYIKAWELSTDSLNGFTNGLPPEDLQYVMVLNRIGGSIVSPPDLSQEFEPEDTVVSEE